MTESNASFENMDEWLVGVGAVVFKDMDTERDALAAIDYLLDKISVVIQEIAKAGNLTQEQAMIYSFASCAVGGILETLKHNPVFGAGVLSDQAMHNYRTVLARAKHVEVDTTGSQAEKGG